MTAVTSNEPAKSSRLLLGTLMRGRLRATQISRHKAIAISNATASSSGACLSSASELTRGSLIVGSVRARPEGLDQLVAGPPEVAI